MVGLSELQSKWASLSSFLSHLFTTSLAHFACIVSLHFGLIPSSSSDVVALEFQKNPQDPDFRHRFTKECLWIHRSHTPGWVNDLFSLALAECTSLEVVKDGRTLQTLNFASQGSKTGCFHENLMSEECIAPRNIEHLVSGESNNQKVVLNRIYHNGSQSSGEAKAERNLESISAKDSKARCNLENFSLEESRVRQSLLYQESIEGDLLAPHLFEELICFVNKCRKEKNSNKALSLIAFVSEKRIDINVRLGNGLMLVFIETGNICDAQHVFDMMKHHDEKTWSILIQGYVTHGKPQKALELYQMMQIKSGDALELGLHTFVALIKACSQLRDLKRGSEVHEEIKQKVMLEKDAFIGSALIDMYAKCGAHFHVEELFDKIQAHDVVSWTALIGGYVDQGCAKQAIALFIQMQQQGVIPDSVTFIYILKACGMLGATTKSCILVKEVFERLPNQQTIFWNALISGYVEYAHVQEAFHCHQRMEEEGISPDVTSFVCLFKACSIIRSIEKGHEVHQEVSKRGWDNDVRICSSLVDLNAKCGLISEAQNVFARLPAQEIVSWNALMTGFIDHDYNEEVLRCFQQLKEDDDVTADSVTYLCCLKACSSTGNIDKGHEIHADIARGGLEVDTIVGTSLIDMYSKFGLFSKSYAVFEKLLVRDIVSWNTLIAGCVVQGNTDLVIKCFDYMQLEGMVPHIPMFLSILKACGSVRSVDRGEEMHAEIVMRGLESDLFVGSSLIDMYSKCGFLETAEQVFNTLPNCDVVSWNALIAGFTEYGCAEEALNNFLKMQCRGFSPDDFTFSCVLKSCAKTEASEKSQELHAAIIQKGLERDLVVGSTLVGAYSKCGSSAEAHDVFTFLPVPDVVAWTALIAGHGLQLGEAEKAIHVLNEMIREGVEPNLVTFVGVLNACSNAGLITEGENCLGQIRENYGSILRAEHFTCMVDLLGRAGHLDEAIAVIKKMPFHPGAVVWQSLLGACRKWGHVEFGKLAFENAVSLDQKNVAAYVCMANIYAEDAKEDKVECFS